ncbi:saccharopine dehydrogenase family protein [Natronococcus wangiae]|uniref:saccharopine dehydrogenase family protein n=1 Tax=Natronococcus wangiae TaxID=3068275 RepID=UPI00273FE13D|nr:saccharopine dehydrogenase NADP-binding domain-containing protein [Natronococcus sp. AD5]
MTVVVFGGAGVMGAEIMTQLLRQTEAPIIVADHDTEPLRAVDENTTERVTTKQIDIYEDDLANVLEAADIAVNAVGPFYRHGTRILDACLESGTNYLDICDDYDTTETLLNRHTEAQNEDVTAIIGIGASPGLTNLLGKHGYAQLESVTSIEIYWAESAVDPTGPAAVDHWMHISWGDVPMYIDGTQVMRTGLSEPEPVSFQNPLGELDVVYTGHPEPITLSRTFPDLERAVIKGAIFPPSMMDVYRNLNRLGAGSQDLFEVTEDTELPFRQLAVRMVRASPYFSRDYFSELAETVETEYDGCAAGFRIVVTGSVDGTDVTLTYDLVADSVKETTAVPAALCTRHLLENNLSESGVYPPEAVIDPDPFLVSFSDKTGIEISETRKEKSSRDLSE